MVRKVAFFSTGALALFGILGIFFYPRAEAQTVSCDTPAEKAACQAQYNELEAEIAQQQQIIAQTQTQEKSLGGDITSLSAQITAAQKQIDAKNIQLKQLSSDISEKTAVIGQLSDQINAGHESLASMLRQEQALDDVTPAEVAFSSTDISSFFADADAFSQVETNLQTLFTQIRGAQAQTQQQKDQLAAAQASTSDAKYEIQGQQQKIASDKTQKQQLLNVASASEAAQQKVLAANQAEADAIKAALFPLRDAAAIQFGTALQYAEQAEKGTGVDPALVLAILEQESNLGANVGQCYLTDDTTGAGVGKNTGTPFDSVMNPARDVPPFLVLANTVGFDPHHQVVSCPQGIGWGGAMGPAQFEPSTWTNLESEIASVTGHATPNPWDPYDAITAMSVFLGQLGASAGGYTAEHTAAAKYYAGGGWATYGQGYADSVMAKVAAIQQNIDFLANNS